MVTDILLDFFGTLVRYTPGVFHTAPYAETHRLLLARGFQIGYDEFADEFAAASDALEGAARRTLREYHMDDVARGFFEAAFGVDPGEDVLAPFVSAFIAEWSRGVAFIEGVEPMLAELAGSYRLSVVSNTHYPPLVRGNLAAMGAGRHIASVVTSVEVGLRKPHPAIFERALAAVGAAPARAVYVGDTLLDDYRGATGAGLRCLLIDPDGRHPEVPTRIASVLDLPAALAEL